MSTPSFQPDPCTTCGGGGGAAGFDAEGAVLCDFDAQGNVVGTALVEAVYDQTTGIRTGTRIVHPVTGDPYVPQGTLRPCDTGDCGGPQQFCFTTSSTGPVEHPGRQYDLTLPINPGFTVQTLSVDATNHAANIVWNVEDPDGEDFRQELAAFIDARVPASATVTITNPNAGTPQVCGAALPMQIHIECVRLDQDPPDLIELVYNGGQDLIQNPAYNESPALNPPVSQGNYGFRLLSRTDDPGPFPGNQPANDALCTSVANRGWETNDVGRTFEIWGQDIVNGSNVTPTPRGTPVQEITSDGPPPGGLSTIWQTFQAPATGNFVIRVVHGARDAGEVHRITLDNGDTDDAQNGDLIDDITNPGVVTNSPGGPGPWTTFSQTIPLTAGNVYTLSLSSTNPVSGARGGLFTDMRAYIDRPDLRATATTDDDTCTVSVDETTTVTDCQWWDPQCDSEGITTWTNVETNAVLTNVQFWSQVPAPDCCIPAAAEGSSGSVAANLVHSYPVCAVVGGVATTLQRVVITDASGGALLEQFIGPDGGPVAAPADYTIGTCADTAFVNDEVLCDDNGPFVRKYVQSVDPSTSVGRVIGFRDFTLAGAVYTPVGSVGVCGAGQTLGETCYQLNAAPGFTQRGFMTLDEDGAPALYDLSGDLVAEGTYGIFICPQSNLDSDILCDFGNADHQFRRSYILSVSQNNIGPAFDTELDGITLYVPVGPVGVCGDVSVTDTRDSELQILCDATPTRFLRKYLYDGETGAFVGVVNTTLDGTTPFVPVGAVGICTTPVATDFDFVVLELCDANGGFLRRLTFNSSTGAVTSTVNTTLAGAAYVPSGTVGSCETCCPVVVGEGCSDTGSGRYTALRLSTGAISLIDAVTGAAITGANVIACDPDEEVLTGIRRVTGVTVQQMKVAFPGLQSITLTVIAGTVLVTLSDGTNQAIPVGVSLTWSVNDTDDSSLAAWTCVGSASEADYILNWTYKLTAAG